MPARYPDVVPFIKEWLTQNHERIGSFWIGADWSKWARFELFMVLEKVFQEPCLVLHSIRMWSESDEEVDILLDPLGGIMKPLAIKLRCEKVNENCGSYEDFRDQADADMVRIKNLGDVDGDFEGAKLLLIGFSGEPSYDEHEFKTQPQPKHFQAGEVHCWVMEYTLPPQVEDENGGEDEEGGDDVATGDEQEETSKAVGKGNESQDTQTKTVRQPPSLEKKQST